MKGPVPVIPVLKPTDHDIQTLPRLQLTSSDILWNPNDLFCNYTEEPIEAWYNDDPVYQRMSRMQILENVSSRNKTISSITGSPRPNKCDASYLARLWGIGLKAAQQTLESTLQNSIRTTNELPLKSNYFDKRVDCRCRYGRRYGFNYSEEK